MPDPSKKTARDFASKYLPLYCGPEVKLRVSSSEQEYTVSKSLLCAESSYFAAVFDKHFLGCQQIISLEEREGVVSVRSLEALIQWLYLRDVVFDKDDPGDRIDAAIELVRLADAYNVRGIEASMARYIKDVLISNPHPKSGRSWRHVDTNTYCLSSHHIAAASLLPSKHSVRRVLAAASVEGYFRDPNHKFARETQIYPSFGADLLEEVGRALDELRSASEVAFEDPISGNPVKVNVTPDF